MTAEERVKAKEQEAADKEALAENEKRKHKPASTV